MQKNDIIELEITDITNEGSGVGKYGGMAVFVPMTAVGDKISAKILKVKKTYAYAKCESINVPSRDRIEVDCPSFNKCGGCVFRHINYPAELHLKERKVYECIKRIGGEDIKPQPAVPAVSENGYRNKAQYPVGKDGVIGFYANHSHRIIPCENCLIHPPFFNDAAKICGEWIEEFGVSVYDEASHKGLLRHIYIRFAQKTDEIMITLVINGGGVPHCEVLIKRLSERFGTALKSVQININKSKTNVILGDECRVIFGGGFINDVLCGVKVRLSPMSFYQVNRDMAELLYQKAAEYAEPEGKSILDLYCGAGTIGLSMADKAKSIIGVEIIPEAVEDARFNAEQNGIKNAEFICGDASFAAAELTKRGIHPDVVIVDPPRKGCDSGLITEITRSFKPKRVVYVSCDPATLARDIAVFRENGYKLKEYTPVDLFPRTAHIETAALLLPLA